MEQKLNKPIDSSSPPPPPSQGQNVWKWYRLPGVKVGFYSLLENFSNFTAACRSEHQPMPDISMFLFHMYLICWVFFKSQICWSGFFLSSGNLVRKSHAAQPSALPTALFLGTHPGPLSGRSVEAALSLSSSNHQERMLPLLCAIISFAHCNLNLLLPSRLPW